MIKLKWSFLVAPDYYINGIKGLAVWIKLFLCVLISINSALLSSFISPQQAPLCHCTWVTMCVYQQKWGCWRWELQHGFQPVFTWKNSISQANKRRWQWMNQLSVKIIFDVKLTFISFPFSKCFCFILISNMTANMWTILDGSEQRLRITDTYRHYTDTFKCQNYLDRICYFIVTGANDLMMKGPTAMIWDGSKKAAVMYVKVGG